jgi:hypothetical protein
MSTTPTLTITGSGGKNIATNTITFNFRLNTPQELNYSIKKTN